MFFRLKLVKARINGAIDFLFKFSGKFLGTVILRKTKPYSILTVTGGIFDYDTNLLEETGQFNVYRISTRELKTRYRRYFRLNSDLTDINYFLEITKYRPHQKLLGAYWEGFLWTAIHLVKLSAVISANFSYRWQVELNRSSIKLEIPFIVLHKESLNTDQQNVNLIKHSYHSQEFLGTDILFFNEAARNAFQKIKGIEVANSHAVGIECALRPIDLTR